MESQTSRHKSPASMQQMPASVEAVLGFKYPKDVVLSQYQQLSAGSADNVTRTGGDEAEGASAGGATPRTVTAALLLMAVEAALGIPGTSGRQGNDVEEDGPGDRPELPSSSSSFSGSRPDPSANTAENRAEMTEGSRRTAEASFESSAGTNTDTPAASGTQTETSPAPSNDPVSRTGPSRPSSVTSAPPAPYPTLTPQQRPVQLQTSSAATAATASENGSAPPSVGVPEGTSTPAEERARERKRQLTRLRALREENRRLKARQMCGRCHVRPAALTFLPCGHFRFCQPCGAAYDTCPVCKKTVLADVKTFLS